MKIPFFLIAFMASIAAFADVPVRSKLLSATVYRNGATLQHMASANLSRGNNEVILEGVSSYLDVNSLQVKCPATVTILGMEFSNTYSGNEGLGPNALKWQDSLASIEYLIQKQDVLISTYTNLIEVLEANKEVKGNNTSLSVAELAKLMTYYEGKRIETENKLNVSKKQKAKLEKLKSAAYANLQEERKKNTLSGGRIILQLNAALALNADFDISYFTSNASWVPYYDIRADAVSKPLNIILKARISQTTGIDWAKVNLSLSTSTPRQYGNAPILRTWLMRFANPVSYYNKKLEEKNTGYAASTVSENDQVVLRGISTVANNKKPLVIIDGRASDDATLNSIDKSLIQSMDILNSTDAVNLYGNSAANGVIVVTLKNGLEDFVNESDNELDVTYDISIPYDVPTNGKPQLATIREMSVPASYSYYAVPKLSNDVYLLANVQDWHALNLLPGEANVIFENTYVGKTVIDPTSVSDTLALTLGVDKRVTVKREKVKDFSSVKFIGTNTLNTFTYEISVKNNKKEAIDITIKDQYPLSSTNEIETELLQATGASVNRETGVLTWKDHIEAGNSKSYRLGYSVKYPRSKSVHAE